MESIDYYIRFTVLGIVAVIIHSLSLSELYSAIAIFVFGASIFFIIILAVYDLSFNRLRYYNDRIVVPEIKEEPLELPRKIVIPKSMRYIAHEKYRQIGAPGQTILADKNVAIVGLSPIGMALAQTLARAGIGTLNLFDNSIIDLKDLDHPCFFEDDIGKPKAAAAEERLGTLNKGVHGHVVKVKAVNEAVINSDLVIDCTNEGQGLIARHCEQSRIPFLVCLADVKKGQALLSMGKSWDEMRKSLNIEPDKPILAPNINMAASILSTLAIRKLLRKPDYRLVSFDSWSHTIDADNL